MSAARDRSAGRILVRALLVLILLGVSAGTLWALTCPCGTVPGFVLRGVEREAPVADWRFANDVPLCQIQIRIGWRPHSLNLNCMATPNGELFLSCSFGERKYWCPRVGDDEPGRLRLDGVVYPVILNRVTDAATLDRAWAARVRKLQDPIVQKLQPAGVAPAPDARRPESWWSFKLESAAGR